ncbi:uncharacterized protein LOC135185778 isoform X6 [Pogoniulus pusillus]|uniref:uncharacterized protein LOC135185778 isoform X6 n=1 Tax=Pogoniulus pusillus TaxID=488313 RepID=UPI0030B96D73
MLWYQAVELFEMQLLLAAGSEMDFQWLWGQKCLCGAKKETFFTCFSCASSSVCLLRCFCLFLWQRSVCFFGWAQAGDGLLQRSKRVLYEAKAAVMINKEQVRLKELCRKQESATCHPSPPDPNPRNPKQHLAQEVSRVAVSPSSPGILCFSQQHGVGYQQQSRLNL